MIKYNNIIIFLPLFCAAVYAQNLLAVIGWRHASWPVIIILLLVLLSLIGALAAYYFIRKKKEVEENLSVGEELFDKACERIGLNATEKSKLRLIVGHEKTVQPQVILQSVSMFEKCIDAEVKRILSQNIDSDVRSLEAEILENIRKKAGFNYIPLEHPLVSTRNISLGQVGSIFGTNHRIPIIQSASVMYRDEFLFRLQYDMEKEDVFQISSGSILKFVFTRQNDGLYGVKVPVVNAEPGYIDLSHTTDMRRNQLRQFVRVEANLPIKIRLLKTDDPEKSSLTVGQVYDTMISDLSGGGLSFLFEQSFKPGDVISVSFMLPGVSFAGISCKVLRISLQEGKTKNYYRHHVQFVNLEVRKRDCIVKYVFDKQRQVNQWR